MSALSDKLNKAKFAFKDEYFSLNGPLNKKRDQLMAQIFAAQQLVERNKESGGGDQRINLPSPVKALQEQMELLEEEMRADLIGIRFTAVNNGLWQKWIIQNPPRKGNALDQSLGYNSEKFFWVAATQSGQFITDPGTEELDFEDAILEPISDDEWKQIDEKLTAGDWDRVDTMLIQLNQRDGQRGADFLFRGSQTTRNSETTPEPPVTTE